MQKAEGEVLTLRQERAALADKMKECANLLQEDVEEDEGVSLSVHCRYLYNPQ